MSELRAGVVGVGSMGRHHARVYGELPGVELAAVTDADADRAESVATTYGARAMDRADLLDAVDVVSVAVPTAYHADVVEAAVDADTHVLVEKPFVGDEARGEELVAAAEDAGVVLQVGHVERFNPAVTALADVVGDLDVIAVDAQRLGPPTDRSITDSVALDLMIHDADVLLSLVDDPVAEVDASGTADDQYAAATVRFESGVVATLTASRVTQQKVRTLSVTAADCRVNVDYLDQSVHIHRQSAPTYVEADDGVRYRNQSVIERPTVDNGEPLKKELTAFVEAARTGGDPAVSGRDGLRALRLVREIDDRIGAGDADAAARRTHTPETR